MFGLTDVAQFRTIQESLTALTFILAPEKLPDGRKNEIENVIRSRANELFGENMGRTGKAIQIQWVERIPPDPSGKIRILISKVCYHTSCSRLQSEVK